MKESRTERNCEETLLPLKALTIALTAEGLMYLYLAMCVLKKLDVGSVMKRLTHLGYVPLRYLDDLLCRFRMYAERYGMPSHLSVLLPCLQIDAPEGAGIYFQRRPIVTQRAISIAVSMMVATTQRVPIWFLFMCCLLLCPFGR